MARYNPKEIEPKWQARWAEQAIYKAADDSEKPKKYVLEYFPYPSGSAMHVGHVRNYAIGDVLARFYRMNGYNVLHPMGWDAFGLPAENYAIKHKISPRSAIEQNTARFKSQLTQMGFSYDWSREIDSSDPQYYRWTQWLFLLLFKKGLAYQQESLQWWCPFDKTVLANEQVEAGRCWRCGNSVTKKSLKQWFFKITDYADRLLDDLDDLNWSEAIKSMQRNWIGRSSGVEIRFGVSGSDNYLEVFTTRPDTLYGATFLVIAPEHPLVPILTTADQKTIVANYITTATAKSDIERQETDRKKTGVFSGSYAVNPINQELLPIWIADYVLGGYGTGAIMAVPAHDQRDYEFAAMFKLPIKPVVAPFFRDYDELSTDRPSVVIVARDPKTDTYCVLKWHHKTIEQGVSWPGGGIDSGETVETAAIREFIEETGYSDVTISRVVPAATATYYKDAHHDRPGHIRSVRSIVLMEVNSMAHSGIIGQEAYEKNAYEVLWLPKDQILSRMIDEWKAIADFAFNDALFDGEGVMINSGAYDNLQTSTAREAIVQDLVKQGSATERINFRMRDWLISRQRYWGAPIPIIHCKIDGAVAVPEDQLPVQLPDIDSYEPSGDGRSPLATISDFVQTTCPKCGGHAERETDTMDGFACSSWYFLRFADPDNTVQAFAKDRVEQWLPVDDYIGGAEHAVMHLLYARFWTKVIYDEGLIGFEEPFSSLRNHGMILAPDGAKMSKSKGNTIEPGSLIEQGYGADSVRIMELFIGPWNQAVSWSVEGMGGAYRFLQRIWTLAQEFQASLSAPAPESRPEIARVTHQMIKRVTRDLNNMSFNTALAAQMEGLNDYYKLKAQFGFGDRENWSVALQSLLQLVAPFAPHIAEELWQQQGMSESIHLSSWPTYDEQYLVNDSMHLIVQINGKLRDQLTISSESTEAEVLTAVRALPKIAEKLSQSPVVKTIYVPGKLVNFVQPVQ